tara:strand:- start:245 stop:586 length:342 start_codon:yes stop_codon:yes gene_type:complete
MYGQNIYSQGILGFGLIYQRWSFIPGNDGRLLETRSICTHVRHLRSVGLSVVSLGLLVQWPTVVTVVLWSFLAFASYLLAIKEECEVAPQFPEEYTLQRNVVAIRFSSTPSTS